MAIQLKLDYSKKLGLPQYSSHQFSVSLTAEVNDVAQIPAEVERIYRVLQDAVDGQIVAPGFVPGGESASVSKISGVSSESGDDWKCSPAQKNLILDLVEQRGLEKSSVDALAKERFGVGVKQLNKLQASGLIDELMSSNPESKPRFNANRNAPRRTGNAYAGRRVS